MKFTGERLIPTVNLGRNFYYEHIARYLFAAAFVKGKSVLDAGCGTGYGSLLLKKWGKAKSVLGVDISTAALQFAKKNYSASKVSYLKSDVETLGEIKGSSFEVITCFEVIEHLQNPQAFVLEAKRLLKSNGILLISTPNKHTYPKGNPFHRKEFYPREFSLLLKKYFKNVLLLHQSFEFSQIIKTPDAADFRFLEKYAVTENYLYTPPPDTQRTEYVLAVCSQRKLPKIKSLVLSTKEISGRKFEDFPKLISQQRYLKEELRAYKASRFYKIWKTWQKLKRIFLKSE